MDSLTLYLMKSTFLSGVFVAYYWIFLRNKKMHRYNRTYLNVALSLSAIVPFFSVDWLYLNVTYSVAEKISSHAFPVSSFTLRPWSLPIIVFVSMAVISIWLISRLLWKIHSILAFKKRHAVLEMDGYQLIETDLSQAPFTFFSNLFWRTDISWLDEHGARILEHELAHISQQHSIDKLFFRCMAAIFWINPFYWIMCRELETVHEFMADEAAIHTGDTAAFAGMLLQGYNNGSYLTPYHCFFNSPIKRRLTMITNINKASHASLRSMLSVPVAVLAVAVTILACRKEGSHSAKAPESSALAKAMFRDRGKFEYKTVMGWVGSYRADGTIDSTWGEVTYRVPLKK